MWNTTNAPSEPLTPASAPATPTAPAAAPLPPAPTTATPPAPELPTTPDTWQMPTEGMGWCDCGKGCELDKESIEKKFRLLFGKEPEWVPHPQLCLVIQKTWLYEEVCDFFFDHVTRSAAAVHGKPAKEYPYQVAVEIVGYFSKTWQGCPSEICGGDSSAHGSAD